MFVFVFVLLIVFVIELELDSACYLCYLRCDSVYSLLQLLAIQQSVSSIILTCACFSATTLNASSIIIGLAPTTCTLYFFKLAQYLYASTQPPTIYIACPTVSRTARLPSSYNLHPMPVLVVEYNTLSIFFCFMHLSGNYNMDSSYVFLDILALELIIDIYWVSVTVHDYTLPFSKLQKYLWLYLCQFLLYIIFFRSCCGSAFNYLANPYPILYIITNYTCTCYRSWGMWLIYGSG